MNDKAIQKIVKEILLKEPKYQYPNMLYQTVWRYWEYAAHDKKPLSALSPEAFIELNVRYGTVESILRARRKVLQELGVKDITRYEQAHKHRLSYLNKKDNKGRYT